MKFLALDIGASGGKAILGNFGKDSLETTEIRRFTNGIVEIQDRRHWDILRLFDEVKTCIKVAGAVDGIGIDTWGVDYGYVGRDGDLLGIPFAYRDSRTVKSIQYVHDRIPFEKLYRITGTQFLPFNTIYQLADDLISRPWIVDNASTMLMIPELLGWLLTGEKVGEYTNASTSGLLDTTSRIWSKEIVEAIGYPVDRLPRLVNPGSLTVGLSDRIADETGSSARFTFTACHDTASAVAGIPSTDGNWAFISSGTWSLVGMELDAPIVTDDARKANFTNEGGVDGKIRFLTNVTGMWILEELRRAWKRDGEDTDFAAILSAADIAPRFKSLIDPDHPSFLAPGDMRVAIRDYCRTTGQTIPNGIGPFSRCVFESLALSYARKIHALEGLTGKKIDRINVVGGGSRNPHLCRMTSDACGVDVIAGPVEATSMGNLIVQAASNGAIGNISEGRSLIARSTNLLCYKPSKHEMWQTAGDRFERIRTALPDAS